MCWIFFHLAKICDDRQSIVPASRGVIFAFHSMSKAFLTDPARGMRKDTGIWGVAALSDRTQNGCQVPTDQTRWQLLLWALRGCILPDCRWNAA